MILHVHLVAKWQREVMVIFALNEQGDEDCEWIDIENIDIEPSALVETYKELNIKTHLVLCPCE